MNVEWQSEEIYTDTQKNLAHHSQIRRQTINNEVEISRLTAFSCAKSQKYRISHLFNEARFIIYVIESSR